MAKKKTIEVNLPDYFAIKHYKSLGSFEHLEEYEKVVATVAATTEHSSDEIMKWSIVDLMAVYKGVSQMLSETSIEFYPVFEFRGVTYGFQPLSKMSVGEFIDLELRSQDPIKNLEEIMGILYRPVTKSRFDGMEWRAKSYIKTLVGSAENMFKYYDVEEYDTEKRDYRAEIFKELPIHYALGSLNFFLVFALILQKNIVLSSPEIPELTKTQLIEELNLQIQLLSIGDGYMSLETSILPNFSTLLGKTK